MDQTRRGTGAMWQRMCGDTDGDPWKNLGDCTSSQGPPTRTCAVNAAAERYPAPVLSRYRRPAKAQREAKHMAANPGKEKARFPFSSEHGLITKTVQAVESAKCTRKDSEMCFPPKLCAFR